MYYSIMIVHTYHIHGSAWQTRMYTFMPGASGQGRIPDAQGTGRPAGPLIWNPVPLVQGGTRWYVLVQAGTYASGYMAIQETSNWYKPVRTDIGNS